MNKAQLLLYLTIGNLIAAVVWNSPVSAWDLATWATDSINGIHDSLAPGRTEAQTPIPVPQMQAPIGNAGNSATIQPCAAPPPISSSSPVSSPSPVQKVEEPEDRTISPILESGRRSIWNAKHFKLGYSSIVHQLHHPDWTDYYLRGSQFPN